MRIKKKYALFARWYCDSPEPFDNWVHVLAQMPGSSAEDSKKVIKDWLESKISSEDQSFFCRAETLRAMILLGADGLGFAEIQAKTAFDEKKIRNIIFRLNKTGKIKRKSRGIYIAA